MMRRQGAAFFLLLCSGASAIDVGGRLPGDVELDLGFPPKKIKLNTICQGRKVVLVGLPGAFTPTWSTRQIPGYKANLDKLKAKGINEVAIFAVNDGAVMDAWAKDQQVADVDGITLYGDPASALTKELGVVLQHPGPMSVLGYPRCKRFSMLVNNCIVKTVHVAEAEDDPAGDARPEVSLAEGILKDLDDKKDEL